jgi:hypothetical protein
MLFLIVWIKMAYNANYGSKSDRAYLDCMGAYQGLSIGWVDQYHHATDGQRLEITGAPPGTYYLVSTANPDGVYLEKDTTNNTAWVAVKLTRDSSGNPKIEVVSDSYKAEAIGALANFTANR